MTTPANLKYTKSHEWVKLEADGTVTVGITHHAQELLGDLVFVETPAVGRTLKQGDECAVVESVKAAADVFAPVSGEVIAANAELADAPEKINQGRIRGVDVQVEARQSRRTLRVARCGGVSGDCGCGQALKSDGKR